MKKFLATVLASVMVLSMVACGNKNAQTSETPSAPAVEVMLSLLVTA